MKKGYHKIGGELKKGWFIPVEKLKKITPFNDWNRIEVDPSILINLKCRKAPKDVLKAFASGTGIPTDSKAVFGIDEVRKDGNKIDRDHYAGYLVYENSVFLMPDKDKSKKHNYNNVEELKDHIKDDPPHKKD